MDLRNIGDLFPTPELNEKLRNRIFNNVAHEMNVLLGPDAWKNPVNLLGKSISFTEGKYVVFASDGKPISYHPDSESAIKAALYVNMAETAFGKSIKQENGKYVVYDGDKPIKTCPDYATAVMENAKVEIGKIVQEKLDEIAKQAKETADKTEITKTAESTAKSGTLTVTKAQDGSVNWELEFPITKLNDEKRLVGGIVYEPDTVDAQGDSASEAEIEKAAHNFLQESRTLGLMHKEEAGPRAKIVESYVAPCNMKINNQNIRKGTWVMVVKVHDNDLWEMVKSGKITGFSMGGRAREEKA